MRRRDSGESDRSLTLLTPSKGKIEAIAKGARKQGSRLNGMSEPLSKSLLTLTPGKKRTFVTQSQPISSYPKIRADYLRLLLAISISELFSSVLPWEEPSEEAFHLLDQTLQASQEAANPLVTYIWSAMRLMDVSGFLPTLERCVDSDEPLTGPEGFLSPQAGGLVSAAHANQYSDRRLVKREVLIGLSRISQLEGPPDHLKFADECFWAMLPLWRGVTEAHLPATIALGEELQHVQLRNRTS